MTFIDEFIERGYFYQCTDLEGLKSLLSNKSLSEKSIGFYIGFDCTATSLHAGNLMQIMILRLLQKHGYKPIVIVGGSTTKIGDPSGKDETRKILTDEDINNNIAGIKAGLSKFIKFGDGKSDAIMLNNSTWLESLGYIEFLTNYGREFSINRMLTMDSVRLRLEREQNLTFLEFNYMLLQAYDFMHLAQNYDCMVQLGGSDQWGNILMGAELTRRKTGKTVFGITTPLLTTASGAKMGKSASGAVWINEDKLKPYDYYQYWRNTEDSDVVKFSRLYAEFDSKEQANFDNLAKDNINDAKKVLALKLTELCHGKVAAEHASETARKVFEEGDVGEDLETIFFSSQELDNGIAITDLFYKAGLTDSKSESKKLIRGGGARVNNQKIEDENLNINSSFLTSDNYIKLSSGKKRHILVKLL